MHYRFLIIATLLMVNTSAIAQTPIPKPDQNGDYFSNETPIQGRVPPNSRLSPGSLWQVISPRLNCRRQASASAPIVRQFKSGDILQAEVFRGGSDEVLSNAKDANGKPWMWVRAKTFRLEDACHVRANRRYIKPVSSMGLRHPPKQHTPGSTKTSDVACERLNFGKEGL